MDAGNQLFHPDNVATVKEEEEKASIEDQDAVEELPTARANQNEEETISAPIIQQ